MATGQQERHLRLFHPGGRAAAASRISGSPKMRTQVGSPTAIDTEQSRRPSPAGSQAYAMVRGMIPRHLSNNRQTNDIIAQFVSGQPTHSRAGSRSEEHTSELQSLMRISYAVFCLKKKNYQTHTQNHNSNHYTATLYT